MSEPEQKSPPEATVVSKSFRPSLATRYAPQTPKGKKLLVFGLVVALVAISAVVLARMNQKEAEVPALKVGKYSYSRAEYQKLIKQAKAMKVSEPAAYRALKEALASRQAADELHVSYPTDKTALNNEAIRYHKLYMANPQISDYQRDTSYTELTKTLVALAVYGSYKVGYVDFPFARYIVAGNNAQWHNLKLIKDDIVYAKTQAQQYKQELIDHKQSIETLVDKARADKRLTYGQSGNLSDVFYANDRGNMYSARSSANVVEPHLLQLIKKAQVGNVSELMTGRWSNDTGLKLPSIQHGITIDVSYYFVLVQDKTSARPTLQKDFSTHKQEYL